MLNLQWPNSYLLCLLFTKFVFNWRKKFCYTLHLNGSNVYTWTLINIHKILQIIVLIISVRNINPNRWHERNARRNVPDKRNRKNQRSRMRERNKKLDRWKFRNPFSRALNPLWIFSEPRYHKFLRTFFLVSRFEDLNFKGSPIIPGVILFRIHLGKTNFPRDAILCRFKHVLWKEILFNALQESNISYVTQIKIGLIKKGELIWKLRAFPILQISIHFLLQSALQITDRLKNYIFYNFIVNLLRFKQNEI